MLNNATILITGGTGSFGKKFVTEVFKRFEPKKIIIYSRDEYKQFIMRESMKARDKQLRYFIGDVRDKERMRRAFEGVDYVIHAAALKQVPACEYNPFEAVKTNIHGAENVVDNAIDSGVKKVVALSTDKAVNPINLYGATKLASDKLFIAGNAYVGARDTAFSIVRYGNVAGSRGSVIPFFKALLEKGETSLPITDYRMTRFWITLDEAVGLVFRALDESKGGETYIAKIPSFKVTDLAKAIAPNGQMREIGIREGEKLHEVMITESDSFNTYEYDGHYVIYPSSYEWWSDKRMKAGGKKVPEFFRYSSDNNTEWLSAEQITERMTRLGHVD
jgi:UDP-N-acetylglucosamine 4,6-dehydratase (inverting)